MKEDVTPTVEAMEQIALEGNVIPMSWFKTIKKAPNGRVNLLAVNLLGDIVYWYRPTVLRDEDTNEVVSKSKRFKADKLQRSYSQIMEMFGVKDKDTVKDAVDLLVELGLITREFRTIEVGKVKMNNVMFLEPVPAKIREISYRVNRVKTPMGENPPHLPPKNRGSLPPKNPQTNTSITSSTNSIPLGIENRIYLGLPVTEWEYSETEIKRAVEQTFPFKVSWGRKRFKTGGFIPQDFLDMTREEKITPELIVRAADVWKSDRRFNWQIATLEKVWERWPALVEALNDIALSDQQTNKAVVK